jgi:hypothetical protein
MSQRAEYGMETPDVLCEKKFRSWPAMRNVMLAFFVDFK